MKDTGIYIHIPFCLSKCLYCDFTSFRGRDGMYESYKNALLKEIRNTPLLEEYLIKSIFIGGGTPTVLPPRFISEIMEELSKLHIADDAEITIEANPKTLNMDYLRVLKFSGINRLSMGLQSTDNTVLKKIGRIHKYEDFLINYNDALKAGFHNISADIMFGLPGQDIEGFSNTVETISKLGLRHISAYSLIIEEGTPFFDLYEEGKLDLPEESEERKMYYLLIDTLSSKDYIHYEISNFSKKGFESQHNIRYWERGEYFGFGLSAHSLVENVRYENTEDLSFYIENSSNLKNIRTNSHEISEKEAMEEFMFLGLRLIKGIDVEKFKKTFGKDIFSVYYGTIHDNIKKGLLLYEANRIFLTAKGLDLSNMVMADFLF
ncbi:radical SAM family heme chaperone HemW [Anaeropeptidivorans aminofermentans]|uniref:radical SAM family heme chaperone HemW n=1 Tax=Anaeropeptidivorans aminofermentans TaxID=2934315 RepID=UPI0020252FA5|nr:radical SAM family heme chaperone HemW [Anaeropeptidivorans aminofermentans]